MFKKVIQFIVLSVAFTAQAALAQSYPGYSKIFTLARTLNNNQVVYEANLGSSDYPIHPYWIMTAEDGRTEELTRMENNRAYGTAVLEQTADHIKFVIKSFSSHPIVVRLDPATQKPYATVTLASGNKILLSIYLHLTGGLFPGVSSIDVYYQDTNGGPVLHDVIDPNA